MKFKLLVSALLAFVFVMSACATASEGSPTPLVTITVPGTAGGTATQAATETEPPATEAATVTQAAAQTETPAETPTLAGGPNVTVKISHQDPDPHLVDDQGRSLYVYLNDSPNSDTSACMDDCAVNWPPLVIEDVPAAGESVDISLLGTLAREDGSKQVTFKGWPLYYSNEDTIPGTTYGQGYNGVWFLVSPDGEPIQQ